MLQNALSMLLTTTQARLIYHNQAFTGQQLAARAIEQMQLLIHLQNAKHPIAFCMPNSPELHCWHLACFHLGIPIVPIIYQHDSCYIQEIIRLTNATYLFTTTEKHNELLKNKIQLPCKIEIIDDTHLSIASISHSLDNIDLIPSSAKAHELATIIFSSGTSGLAKGIMHSYESFYGFMEILIDILLVKPGLTYLVAQPMGHIGGISTTLMTLLQNGTGILMREFAINEYMCLMQQYQPTHINLHTPLFYELINYPELERSAFKNIICAFAGGDDIPPELPAEFSQKTGAPMRIGYGMTEIGIIILNEHPYDQHKRSVGKKVHSAKIELRDESCKVVSVGEPGEIWVQSPACCLGYWNMAEQNDRTIVADWFRTGDSAYIDEQGYYFYTGRMSQIIHRNTHTIFPDLIEQVLFNCPNVKSAAVIGVNNTNEGEVPIAFVELKSPLAQHDMEVELMRFAKCHLRIWQIPQDIIILDKLPLNLTGKIDRHKLHEIYMSHK